MKYKVVGWTSYDDMSVEDSGNTIGFAERHAIIDNIKANGYLFSGYDHQEMWDCAPVLNDGKKRCFSQRGWGGVMAEAHGYFGAYDYSLFTFGIKEEAVKRPRNYFVADNFTPEEELAEHFEIDVDEGIFALANRRNPFFLPDLPELRFIDAGDTLTLHFGEKTAEFKVTEIGRSPAEEGEPYKIDTKYKISVSYLREDLKITLRIPAPTPESTMLSALLNGMVSEYASILGENYRKRKAEYFEKCRALAEKMHGEGKITLYAGDCAFSDFSFAISAESGHFTAVNVFCTDSENFYIMGVCRDSTSLFRRFDTTKDDLTELASNRWGKLGVYFER